MNGSLQPHETISSFDMAVILSSLKFIKDMILSEPFGLQPELRMAATKEADKNPNPVETPSQAIVIPT